MNEKIEDEKIVAMFAWIIYPVQCKQEKHDSSMQNKNKKRNRWIMTESRNEQHQESVINH